MAFDAHKNFAYGTIATAPSPATSGTSLVVTAGQGANFPSTPFNATIWPTGVQPLASNAEVVRVTTISTDTFTITRIQESTSARTVVVGDQIAAAITNKTLTDIETVANAAGTATSVTLAAKRAVMLGIAGTLGATITDGADFIVPIPFDMTLDKIKVTCKTAPSGSMAVQLRLSTNATTPSYSDVSGFTATFTGSQTSAVADPANVDVSEGNLLNVSVSTGSGSNMLVEVTGIAR